MGCSSSTTAREAAKRGAEEPTAKKTVLSEETLGEATKKGAEEPTPPQTVLSEETVEDRALIQLKLIFNNVDQNSSGTVSKTELAEALAKDSNLAALIKEAELKGTIIGFEKSTITDFEKLDTNRDDGITWDEFCEHLKKPAEAEVKANGHVAAADAPADAEAIRQLKGIFAAIDKNGDATVSKEELAEALRKTENLGKLVEEARLNPNYYVLEQLDTNEDGKVTWVEFEEHLKSATKSQVQEQGGAVALADLVEEDVVEEADDKLANSAPWGWFGCSCGAP